MNLGQETEMIEFKKSTAELERGIQTISAMLNKHGKGELFFGVKDNGEIVGQQISDNTIKEIVQKIMQQIEPSIEPSIEQLSSNDCKEYIRIVFTGNECAYKAKGKYYIRLGTSDYEMTTSELKRRLQTPKVQLIPMPLEDVDKIYIEELWSKEDNIFIEDEKILLKATSKDQDGLIKIIQFVNGRQITTNGIYFNRQGDSRELARWESIVNNLKMKGCISLHNNKSHFNYADSTTYYKITHLGYQKSDRIADSIINEKDFSENKPKIKIVTDESIIKSFGNIHGTEIDKQD